MLYQAMRVKNQYSTKTIHWVSPEIDLIGSNVAFKWCASIYKDVKKEGFFKQSGKGRGALPARYICNLPVCYICIQGKSGS
jgi:hypothetical protein